MAKKKELTAEEALRQLREDPDFVARERALEQRIAHNVDEFSRLEEPILRDLRRLGIDAPTLGDARALAKYMPFSPEVAHLFLEWLPNVHERIQDVLVRLLAAAQPFYGAPFARFFDDNGSSHLRWLVATAIAESRPTGIDEWLLKKIQDPMVGSSKEFLLLAAARLLPPERANPAIRAQFEHYPLHAVLALNESGGEHDLEFLQERLPAAKLNERKEINKAIKAIRKRLGSRARGGDH